MSLKDPLRVFFFMRSKQNAYSVILNAFIRLLTLKGVFSFSFETYLMNR